MAPNGYLHAGTVVTLADTSCGYGCVVNLPAVRPASPRWS
jgi:acyl-coenzyme A thioesterase PaaI-like protein